MNRRSDSKTDYFQGDSPRASFVLDLSSYSKKEFYKKVENKKKNGVEKIGKRDEKEEYYHAQIDSDEIKIYSQTIEERDQCGHNESFKYEEREEIDQKQVDINANITILGHIETLKIAMKISPLWFLSNYCYSISLAHTSITSATVLGSTGSLFTFLFAVLSGEETFSRATFAGVVLCMMGAMVTAIGDSVSEESNVGQCVVLGNIAGLVSAIGYGAYTVGIRVTCPKDEDRMSMQLLLGYVGLCNMVLLSPVALFILSRDDAGGLTREIITLLVFKGLFNNVISDYLWARAVVLCSATVATVGLGLTIPLAFLSDAFVSGVKPSEYSLAGAMTVLLGFVVVNVDGGLIKRWMHKSNVRNESFIVNQAKSSLRKIWLELKIWQVRVRLHTKKRV
eukprot:CAMPEP_0172500856 /NCGR_PEP_ID=MMETSP1066-20121228/143947_1 /TAXON_ID=671091 /ORGANISM="Coscinodiscus wailesii, Strain CCMP2513" /LENGTH=393 /DNA_ID=CAMNT_0013275337 /DNA_START=329 /DNA_END=1510 /DNA_ORIENTATION=+